ncbi:MAG: GerMN domain-containing protein [Ilumatobacteraceae bacterium]
MDGFRRGCAGILAATVVLTACSFGAESAPRTIPDRQRGKLSVGFGSPQSLDGEVRLFLPRLDIDNGTRLGSVARPLDVSDVDVLVRELIRTLVVGPTGDERALGFGTAIPQDTQLLDVSPAASRITINLTGSIASLPTEQLVVALAQIVYTMSEGFFAREVIVKVDGQTLSWPREDGTFTEDPLTVFDYPTAAITSQPAYPGIIAPNTPV